MKNKIIVFAALLTSLLLLLGSCAFTGKPGRDEETEPPEETTEAPSTSVSYGIAETPDINNTVIKDNTALYRGEVDDSVVTMYLTVMLGNSVDNTNHTWAEINSYSTMYYTENDIPRYAAEAIFQVGDETGPLFGEVGYGLNVPNATVQVRGATSSRAVQKSYKIKIKSGAGDWNSQKTIALNKHPYDTLRFRNKLSYDLIKTIPEMIGLRTQFVHLYVKDLTSGEGQAAQFVDYGLYTQVEQVNSRYLRNHGFDEQAQLYKATMFEFFTYDDVLVKKDDPNYDVKKFEQILEIKGNDDHTKLIEMLAAVNNYAIPIEEVIDKYFDVDNYLTWFAFQMLTSNTDTTSQNFFLYSPQNSQKWYFISWDNDDAWTAGEPFVENGKYDDYNYMKGVTNYWGSVLHKRMLKSDILRAKFDEKIEYIRSIVTKERLAGLVSLYKPVVEPFIYRMPDEMYAVYKQEMFESLCETVPEEIEYNYQMYKTSIAKPMPFYFDTIVNEGNGTFSIVWDTSYDFGGEALYYTFEVAKDYLFTDPIVSQVDLPLTRATFPALPEGQYFMRLTVRNASGETQTSMEYYEDYDDVAHWGVRVFYVLSDGSIG